MVLAAVLLALAVGLLGYQYGTRKPAAERTAAPAPTTAGNGQFSPATSAPAPTSAPTTAAPAKPRLVGTLITKNLGTDGDPNRVFNAVGQGSTTNPKFTVRAGERLRIKLINRDNIVHSFTADGARTNTDVFANDSTTATFRAPLKPGTYSFYCRYRQLGMNGTLVVRRN
jgi:plastocyanin